jgi:hypothetical protein
MEAIFVCAEAQAAAQTRREAINAGFMSIVLLVMYAAVNFSMVGVAAQYGCGCTYSSDIEYR